MSPARPVARMPGVGPIGSEVERSLARSRVRRKALILLSSLGEAHPGHLARACGVSVNRLKWIMEGHWPEYAPDLTLVALDLATLVLTPHGRVYRVTERGRRKARSVTSSWVRGRGKGDAL